ncbi:transcription initiation factor TFIID subunit 4-like isoform X2 [Stegostoma tigrinum]|uniref:transcription initiation factor TFIID subunit 4-like isoform X2 n=1 Tax=Stegostoma tigrinum TaxID=3053191 RepID=UPI002870A5B0|nr:transcription initiation factor TFIID subunit 4-like isoform X2 [Stegostoma tigrinum]
MAAGSDPLEELFLSEVDEKAVSDLVGSLESQLAGRAMLPGEGRPGPAGGSVPGEGRRRAGRMAPSPLGERAAAPAVALAPAPAPAPASAPGFGQEAAAVIKQPGASASELPPPPATSIPSSSTSAAGARASGAATPGTGRLLQPSRPPPPASPSTSSFAPSETTTDPGERVPPLAALTIGEYPGSSHLPAPQKAPGSPPQAVNGVVAHCSSPAVTAALHFSTATASGTCNHLPTSGAASTFGSNASSINTPCNSSQNGSLNPQFVSVSQDSILMGSSSTPTITLTRPPMHTVIASNVLGAALSQNGIAPFNNVNPPGLVQFGEKTGVHRGAIIAQLANQIAAVSNPICSHTATNTDSMSQTKLVLHTQHQPVSLSLLNNTAAPITVTNTLSNQLQYTVTSSLPVASAPVSVNAVAKSAVNMISQPHVGITKVISSAPGIIQVSAAQPQLPRTGLGAPQRIVTPQLIIRSQQQPTVQLASGFTIPPGMILVRTESGQLVMVPQQALAQAQAQAQCPGSISPRPSAPTSVATFRLTSSQPAMTISSIRPGHPLQAKVVQPAATPVNAMSVAASQPIPTAAPTLVSGCTSTPQAACTTIFSGVTSHHIITSQTQAQSQASASSQSQSATKTQLQVHPQVTPSSPLPGTPTVTQVSVASRSAPLGRAGQEMQENVKKCKNFLATLIKLASHSGQSADTSRNVKSLVQDLLDYKIEPEEFTDRLQSELNSSPQPYLVPFLKKSLPALRQSLVHNQQYILQVNQQTQGVASIQTTSTVPSTGAVTTVVAGSSVQIRQPITDNTVPGTNAVTQAHISLAQQGRSTHLIIQPPVQTVKRQSGPGGQVRLPSVVTPSTRPAGKTSLLQGSKGLSGPLLQVTANQKNKSSDPGGGSFRDDDDINDVTSMAGVNLSEESANILATNSYLVGTQIRSFKDEAFLASGPLHRRILETAKRFGITDVPIDIVNTISIATQERLKMIIGKLTSIAQHRMETHKDHEWYEQATDVRTQLKFFEHLERLEKQRKDDQEREILLKAAKSRSRQEDPEHARLKQKAKEMQQQELAQMRQRDANLTALAAIGPRKKRKLDSPGPQAIEVGMAAGEGAGPTTGPQAGSRPALSRQYTRQRVTRVNLRDFIFYMEQEQDTRHSLVLYRALLK